MSFSFQKQRGFSLIELLFVMGVMAILMVAAFVIFPQVRGAQQAQSEWARMGPTMAGLRAYQDSLPETAPVPALDELIAARLLPSEAIQNGQWVSAAGQRISLEGQPGQWVITYHGLEPSFCQLFVHGMLDSFHNQFSGVSINGDQTLSGSGLIIACQKPRGGQNLVSFVLAPVTESYVPVIDRAASALAPVESSSLVTDPKFVDPKGKKWGTNEGI